MIFSENWAIFAEGEQIRWKFGAVSSETALLTARLASGLNALGQEIFHETVASLRVRDTSRKPPRSFDILIVIMRDYYFLAAQPITTAKMIQATQAVEKEKGIPDEIRDLLHGVLMGQALETYADLWSAAADEQQGKKIDQIFNGALKELGVAEDSGILAKGGVCSLSGLSIPDFLFLHCYLRQRFEKEIQPTVRKPWACILGAGGVPVYLLHNISQTDVEQQLAFLLTAITAYSMDLFKAVPETLVFSRDGLTSINLFVGENTIFAACNPFSLFQDAKFIANFAKLGKPVFNDIINPAKQFLSIQIGEFQAARIRERSFSDLVESLKDIYRELSMHEDAIEEVKLIKGKETLEEMAAQLKAEEEISSAAKAPIRLPIGIDLKILILGDPDVGKTAIGNFLVKDEFAPEYLIDVGAQLFTHKVRIGKSAIFTNIWDPTGKQKLEDMDKAFYAEASGAFIVFDVTKPRSFGTVEQWIDELWNHSKRGPIPLLILGNKVDQRGLDLFDSVDDNHAFDLAEALDEFTTKKHGFKVSYFPVSTITGRNLNLALQLISLRSLLHQLGVKSVHELL